MPPELTLYGVPLTLLLLGVTKLLQDKGVVSDEGATWMLAVGAALAYGLIDQAPLLEAQWPWFPEYFALFGNMLGLFLTVKGYMSAARKLGARMLGLPK